MYPCVDRPDDTFAVKYCVASPRVISGINSSQQQYSVDFALVMRRYVEAERLVLVYVGRAEGEHELTGVNCSCIGYLASSNVSALTQPGSEPISVQQSCMHMSTANGRDDDDNGNRAQRLLKVLMGAFEDDVRFIKQQAGASRRRLGAVEILSDHACETVC